MNTNSQPRHPHHIQDVRLSYRKRIKRLSNSIHRATDLIQFQQFRGSRTANWTANNASVTFTVPLLWPAGSTFMEWSIFAYLETLMTLPAPSVLGVVSAVMESTEPLFLGSRNAVQLPAGLTSFYPALGTLSGTLILNNNGQTSIQITVSVNYFDASVDIASVLSASLTGVANYYAGTPPTRVLTTFS